MTPDLLDVVALLKDIPQESLRRGQIGTVVEVLAPDAVLVEFSDSLGRTYAMQMVSPDDVIVLHDMPVQAAV